VVGKSGRALGPTAAGSGRTQGRRESAPFEDLLRDNQK
jgi:hypothetical protein